jgi:hypothetical protein
MQKAASFFPSLLRLRTPSKPHSAARLGTRLKIAYFDAKSQSCKDSQSNLKSNTGDSLRFLCVFAPLRQSS